MHWYVSIASYKYDILPTYLVCDCKIKSSDQLSFHYNFKYPMHAIENKRQNWFLMIRFIIICVHDKNVLGERSIDLNYHRTYVKPGLSTRTPKNL